MQDAAQRRKALQFAVTLTQNTSIAPDHYERQLLAQYVRGVLTIEQVIERLEQRPSDRSG